MSLFINTETKTDRYGDEREFKTVKILPIVICILLIVLALNSFAIIKSGFTGVRTTFGQIDSTVIDSGFCLKVPFVQSIQKVNNKQQEVSFKDYVWGETSERTVVYMTDVTITYKINPEYSAWLYANVNNYKQNALPQTLVASALKAAMVSLTSTEVTNRGMVEPLAITNIQNALDQKYSGERVITIINVSINDMDFEDSYNKAIADKQIAQMEYEQQQIQNQRAIEAARAEAEQKVIAAQAEAEKKLLQSDAEAESIKIIADAEAEANKKISESITDTLIEYEKAQNWNGELPDVVGSDSIAGWGFN